MLLQTNWTASSNNTNFVPAPVRRRRRRRRRRHSRRRRHQKCHNFVQAPVRRRRRRRRHEMKFRVWFMYLCVSVRARVRAFMLIGNVAYERWTDGETQVHQPHTLIHAHTQHTHTRCFLIT